MLSSLKAFASLALRPPPALPRALLLPLPAFSFCTANHPFIEELLKVRKEKDLEGPLTEMAKLNEANRQAAIRIILQRVRNNEFAPRMLVHDKLVFYIKKFPILHIQSLLFRIELQLKELDRFVGSNLEQGKQAAVKDINGCFTLVFDVLKKIPKRDSARSDIDACKAFANYHYKHLLRLVEHDRSKAVLTKAVSFYQSALAKIAAEAEIEEARAAEEGEPELPEVEVGGLEELTPGQVEHIQEHIEYKRLAFAEEYCEVLYLLMEAQNYLTDPRIKEALRPRSQLVIPFEYHEGLYELLPLFEKAVSLYDNVDNKIFTQYYFKVRKTYLEMQHYALLHQNAQDPGFEEREIQAFDDRMDDFTKEIVLSMKDLSLSEESIEVEETLCMLLLSIKVNKLSRRELEEEEFEMQLLKEVKSILALVPLEDMRKLISGNFIHAIKVVMDLDFEKHLGKIPKLNVRRRPKNKKK